MTCSGTDGSGTVGGDEVVGGEKAFSGEGFCCGGSSETTLSEAAASGVVSEAFSEVELKLDWGSSPR